MKLNETYHIHSLPGSHDMDDFYGFQRFRGQGHRRHFLKMHISSRGRPSKTLYLTCLLAPVTVFNCEAGPVCSRLALTSFG